MQGLEWLFWIDTLQAGDYVLVRVMNDQDKEAYVPGIIQVPPAFDQAQAKFYTALLYNGQQVHNTLFKLLDYHDS